MLFEIHMLKHYPASNLNRDETGAPKTCYFGGSQRGRISSQCLKRSWRTSPLFAPIQNLAWRSRNMPEMVREKLVKNGMDAESIERYVRLLPKIVQSTKSKDEVSKEINKKKDEDKRIRTGQTIFFSHDDVDALVDIAMKKYGEGKLQEVTAETILSLMREKETRAITVDIALFGRMVTSPAFLDVEAAMQVAHAVSTHPVNLEMDYFTAVDDLLDLTGETGASIINGTDFDSCCYYIYASLDVDKLKENLKDSPEALAKVDQLIPVLLRVMAMSNPSGKQNSFAGHVFPEAILIECKEDKIPLSYVNAFAEPVSRTSHKVVQDSIDKLIAEVNLLDGCYCLKKEHRGWMALRSDNAPNACERFNSFDKLVDACAGWIKE